MDYHPQAFATAHKHITQTTCKSHAVIGLYLYWTHHTLLKLVVVCVCVRARVLMDDL